MANKIDPVLGGFLGLIDVAKDTGRVAAEEISNAIREFMKDPSNIKTINDGVNVLQDLRNPESLEQLTDTIIRDGGSLVFGSAFGLWVLGKEIGGTWSPVTAFYAGEGAAELYVEAYNLLKDVSRRSGIGIAIYDHFHIRQHSGEVCTPWGGDIFAPCEEDLQVSPDTDSWFTRAQRWVQRRDPLTFDLDGDGIETVGIDPNNPILFDHDGDGLKTATGWVKADDAFLVLDRNGNATIDNGTELFGDSTPLSGGGNAADGFAALADLDSNHDGQINANDAQFANLHLWRDLNQDGISQSGELYTLAQQNIASINVTKTENNTLLPNGNVLADTGSYTKTDGTFTYQWSGTLGEIGHLGDVDLTENTFFSQYPGIPLTPEAQALPDLQGSGQVRELKAA